MGAADSFRLASGSLRVRQILNEIAGSGQGLSSREPTLSRAFITAEFLAEW